MRPSRRTSSRCPTATRSSCSTSQRSSRRNSRAVASAPLREYPGRRQSRNAAEMRGLMSQTADSTTVALAAPRELLATVLAHLRDGIIVAAAGGELLYANDEAARLTGYLTA